MTLATVVVPTHGRPTLLTITLRSIVAQRDVDFDVVVVDDGSPDPVPAADVVAALDDKRVRLLRTDAAEGVSAARNRGIDAAGGTWIAFCDDDDLWAPDKLARQLAAAREACWVYAGDVTVDAALRVTGGEPPPPPETVVAELGRWNPVPAGSSNVLVRKEALDAVGGFDPALRSGGDWDLWIRLARQEAPAWVRAPLVAYRVHGATMTGNRARMLADAEKIAVRHGVPVDWVRHRRWAAWDALAAGQRREALGHHLQAARAGDVSSLARSATALAPWPVVRRAQRRRTGTGDPAWTREAQRWLDALAER